MQPVNKSPHTPSLETIIEEPASNDLTSLVCYSLSEKMRLMLRRFANGEPVEQISQIRVSTHATVPTINFQSIAYRTPSPQSDTSVTSSVSPTSTASDEQIAPLSNNSN